MSENQLVNLLASMDYTLPDDAKEVAGQLRAIAWRPINSAPRTGEHILVTRLDGGIGFGTCGGKNQAWSAVVHWWDADGEQGWYLSSGNDDNPTQPTHWMALAESSLSSAPCPKCGRSDLGHDALTCRETQWRLPQQS